MSSVSSDTMEYEEAACVYYYLTKKRRKRKNRVWVRRLLQKRAQKGVFHTIYEDLRKSPGDFFTFTRMSIQSFDELLRHLQPNIQRSNTVMRDAVSPAEKLLITLRYLATGCTMTDLHILFRMGLTTVTFIIQEVCQEIWKTMKDTCLAVPDTEKWKSIADDFYRKANYPNCVGALDGKHIRMIQPEHSGSMFFNYKHFFSIVLLAMCDSNYLFTFVDIGAYGKESDAGVFRKSALCDAILKKKLNLPAATPILDSKDDTPLPYVIVGDEAFGLSDHVMRPFGQKSLTSIKRNYNERHIRARRYIECTFGILSNKWRIFHRPMNVKLSFAEDIVKACCVLHNFVRVRDGFNDDDAETINGMTVNLKCDDESRPTSAGFTIREKFAKFFASPEGKLPWQKPCIP